MIAPNLLSAVHNEQHSDGDHNSNQQTANHQTAYGRRSEAIVGNIKVFMVFTPSACVNRQVIHLELNMCLL